MRLITTLAFLVCAQALGIHVAMAQGGCPPNSSVNMEKSKPPNYICSCNPGYKPVSGVCQRIAAQPVQCGPGYELKNGLCVGKEESLQCAPLREQIALAKTAVDRARLALNVYEIYEPNAGPDPKAPPGYRLLSNNSEEMRKLLPGMPEQQVKALLAPADSTYRAAIYRDEAKGTLVLAFRGTVDFVKEGINPNGPNAVFGRKTDFFTNAQALARDLKNYTNKNGLQIEIVGHSLGGGMAIAASAASGSRATVFNPETFRDSALVRGDLSSARELVTTYMTPGEPLSSAQALVRLPAPGQTVRLPDWPGEPLPGTIERHVMRSVRQALNQQQVLLDKAMADNKCAR